MPAASDPDLLVLLGLRLRSFAPAETVAEAVGLDASDVGSRLTAFAEQAWVRHRDGRVSGWMLTPAGRAEGERRLAAELTPEGHAAIERGYGSFLGLNQRLLDACTDWQLRPVEGQQVVNDHTDADYDAAVVEGLTALDALAQPVLADLAEVLVRFGGYGPRLTGALAKVQGGDTDWFTKPTIDSYHTVWFELHENLLATLGIERGSEPASPTGGAGPALSDRTAS